MAQDENSDNFAKVKVLSFPTVILACYKISHMSHYLQKSPACEYFLLYSIPFWDLEK